MSGLLISRSGADHRNTGGMSQEDVRALVAAAIREHEGTWHAIWICR
jgi:hypothetical protein